jgi:hypothetical protein
LAKGEFAGARLGQAKALQAGAGHLADRVAHVALKDRY